MTKRLGLTVTEDELVALEALCSQYQISKADWVRLQIRTWHAIEAANSAIERGEGTIKGTFPSIGEFNGFGYQINVDHIKKLVEQGGQGFQMLIDNPNAWVSFLSITQVSSSPKKRLRKNVNRREKAQKVA